MTAATLSRAEISTQGAWLTAPETASLLADYRALTGTGLAEPAGAAVVVARRAFTRGKQLPTGGVLLGMDVVLGSWEGAGGAQFRCGTAERVDSRGRVIVTVNVELRAPRRTSAPTRISFSLRWPAEADADA